MVCEVFLLATLSILYLGNTSTLLIFQVILFGFVILQEGNKGTINTRIVQWSEIEK